MEEFEPSHITQFLTLVRYAPPVLIGKTAENTDLPPEGVVCQQVPQTAGATLEKETEAILHTILPPRCWEENGQMWQQFVSTRQATRQEVTYLQKMLDTRLQQTQARKSGICALRKQLHEQCFDEIIRQVTINCAERGLLLLRVRDEIYMSIDAYDVMYRSSLAFGLRKARQAQDEIEALSERFKGLKTKHQTLVEAITDLQLNLEKSEERDAEVRDSEAKRHAAEVTFLEITIEQLQKQLDRIEERKLL